LGVAAREPARVFEAAALIGYVYLGTFGSERLDTRFARQPGLIHHWSSTFQIISIHNRTLNETPCHRCFEHLSKARRIRREH